jgi:glutamate-1-semialdehyde 2,1-aminomutase
MTRAADQRSAQADDLPCIEQSERLYARALPLIPSVTQTLAKGPTQYVAGVAPKYLRRGRGCRVWDVDDNTFLDLTMAVGPLVLGYCDPVVDAAIREQLADGITFSLMHPLEVEVAELVRALVPHVEMVRFSKTGADVDERRGAPGPRAHRAQSGAVLWLPWLARLEHRRDGAPRRDPRGRAGVEPNLQAYNDLAAVAAAIDDDTACVILEPVAFELPREGFLQGLRELCDRRGVVLIFDEMWTGFRVALGGAQAHYGVRADLVTFSKAIANGMPLAVLAGRGELLRRCDADVFFYTTFGGEALSLAAARATLHELQARAVPEALARQGQRLQQGYNALAERLGLAYTACVGLPCRTLIAFDPSVGDPLLLKSFVQQELIRCGVLWSGCHNLCWAHGAAEIDELLAAYEVVLPRLRDVVAQGERAVRQALSGEPLQPVFRRTGDFQPKPPPAGSAR